MLTFLRNIFEFITFIPTYILIAVEEFINLFLEGIHAIVVVAATLVPLPEEPAPPEFVAEINWFFPLGAVITVATPIVAGYILFLSVRWILKWTGEL